jgi:hypothetical protein
MEVVYLKLIVGFFVSLLILNFTVRISPKIYSIRYISGYYSFQFIALLGYLLLNPNAEAWNVRFSGLYLKNLINEGVAAYLLFQIGVLLASIIAYFVFRDLKEKKGLVELIKSNPKTLKTGLVFTCIIIFSFPFLSGKPIIGYGAAILFNFLNFMPFAAGVYYFQHKGIRLFWLLALITLFTLGILGGSRGTAITAAALYAIGFYYALESKRAKQWAIIIGFFISIPLMSFMAFVGIFRHMVGRVDFNKIDYARAIKIYNKYEKLKNTKVLKFKDDETELNGWGRFVNYVNFTQLGSIPEKVPHLGWEGLLTTDLKYSFDIAFLSGTTIEERIRAKFGNWKLNDYGYYVTNKSSVEFSILTESFIRFGYTGIFWFAFTIGFFSILIEYLMFRWFSNFPTVQIFATIMISMQALLGYSYNLFVIMRNMILTAFLAVFIVFILMIMMNLFKKQKDLTIQNTII